MKIIKLSILFITTCTFSKTSQAATVAYFTEKNSVTSQEFFINESVYNVTVVNGGYDSPDMYTVQNAISFSAMKPFTTDRLSLYFTHPLGLTFTAGLYSNLFSLIRSPVISGRSNLTGWFKILEIEWVPFIIGEDTPAWYMTKLAIDFHQDGSKYTADGSIRYNSSIALTVPEPSGVIIFTLVGGGLALIRRKR